MIVIPESPPPTGHATAWVLTPTPIGSTSSRRRALRAVAKRTKQHCTLADQGVDAHTQRDCGVLAILKAAKLAMNKDQVAVWRSKLAERVRKTYVGDEDVQAWRARPIVLETAVVAHDTLLSPNEVVLIAQMVGLDTFHSIRRPMTFRTTGMMTTWRGGHEGSGGDRKRDRADPL